jgi:ABC-type uncharacterized transport system substrate-binding protein
VHLFAQAPLRADAEAIADQQHPVAQGRRSFRILARTTGGLVCVIRVDKPADLPVQQSTIIELVINVKTANSLGLKIPPSVLAATEEVIE